MQNSCFDCKNYMYIIRKKDSYLLRYSRTYYIVLELSIMTSVQSQS